MCYCISARGFLFCFFHLLQKPFYKPCILRLHIDECLLLSLQRNSWCWTDYRWRLVVLKWLMLSLRCEACSGQFIVKLLLSRSFKEGHRLTGVLCRAW